MRAAANEFECEAITGPVRYAYPNDLPIWFEATPLKNKPRGTFMKTAATNNTLLKASWYRFHKDTLQFDQNFRFTGGSDTDFFYGLTDIGGRIRWVNDAIVRETMPTERLTIQWQLLRATRTAANSSQIAIKRRGRLYALKRYLPKSIGRILGGVFTVLLAIISWPISQEHYDRLKFKGFKKLASSYGSLQGLVGISPQPYIRVTGR